MSTFRESRRLSAMARITVIAMLVLALFPLSSLRAQVSGGIFRGEVRDASGALVPHAKITIRSLSTGIESPAESSGEGIYQSPTLPAGDYRLTTEKQGFKVEVFGPVNLPVNET